jgi:uncharacterized protein
MLMPLSRPVRTRHDPPERPVIGTHDGLAYAFFEPEGDPVGGVVICHGAGSAKESHFDFARGARAYGLAALAFDARGHGRSEGLMGAGALDDVRAMCDLLREWVPRVALRGSSMGGFCAISAAARDSEIASVVAISPAPEDYLLRALRSDRELEFEADREGLEEWLGSASLADDVAALSPRTALLLLHAEGDEQIPHTITRELYEAAGDPKRLLVVPGGHHRSIQHDGELQAASIKFILDSLERPSA